MARAVDGGGGDAVLLLGYKGRNMIYTYMSAVEYELGRGCADGLTGGYVWADMGVCP